MQEECKKDRGTRPLNHVGFRVAMHPTWCMDQGTRNEEKKKTGDRKLDGCVKSPITEKFVIPAKAGIQLFQGVLDPGLRRGDDWRAL